VTNISKDGFDIEISSPASGKLRFNYLAVLVQGGQNDTSTDTTQDVSPVNQEEILLPVDIVTVVTSGQIDPIAPSDTPLVSGTGETSTNVTIVDNISSTGSTGESSSVVTSTDESSEEEPSQDTTPDVSDTPSSQDDIVVSDTLPEALEATPSPAI
jgi:hypothetical protein